MNFSKSIKVSGFDVKITSSTCDYGVEGSPEWIETDVIFEKDLSKKEYMAFLDHLEVGYDEDMEQEEMELATWDEVVAWAESFVASCAEVEAEENWSDGDDDGFDLEEIMWHPMGVNL